MSVLKKVTYATLCLTFLATGLLTINPPAFSQSKYPMVSLLRCTRDQSILEAFNYMVGSSGEPSLDVIVNKPVRVFFKDLGLLNQKVKNFDALSWLSTDGQQVIFINEKHRGAPPEALAAIIAHEAMHDDLDNSVLEEIAAWQKEAGVWAEMKRVNPSLAVIPEGKYPLVDRLNKIADEKQKGTLEAFVRANPGYKGLSEHSPGY
ncbi:MAG: hypothetical protein K2X66_05700 [Cyanobacteria bacterium]|nr:hypothetical protein [Cyanobacteriota bacterium]